MMKDIMVLRGHSSDVLSLAWHPIHSQLLTTGTHDGTISHFFLDRHLPENTTALEPVLQIPCAHDYAIWTLEYHPLGHILCSGGNDKMTRFWCRARPGDETAFADRYYSEELKLQYQQAYRRGQAPPQNNVAVPSVPVAAHAVPDVTTGNIIPGLR
jgi:polyadenylation factor subunit 2